MSPSLHFVEAGGSPHCTRFDTSPPPRLPFPTRFHGFFMRGFRRPRWVFSRHSRSPVVRLPPPAFRICWCTGLRCTHFLRFTCGVAYCELRAGAPGPGTPAYPEDRMHRGPAHLPGVPQTRLSGSFALHGTFVSAVRRARPLWTPGGDVRGSRGVSLRTGS